jgi:hypothetical protein
MTAPVGLDSGSPWSEARHGERMTDAIGRAGPPPKVEHPRSSAAGLWDRPLPFLAPIRPRLPPRLGGGISGATRPLPRRSNRWDLATCRSRSDFDRAQLTRWKPPARHIVAGNVVAIRRWFTLRSSFSEPRNRIGSLNHREWIGCTRGTS